MLMKSKYKIRGLTDESNMALNKSVLTHVRKVLGVPQTVYTTFNTSLSDVHLAIHKTTRNSTSQYITVRDAENIKEFDKEYIDSRDYTVTTPVFEDPTYIKIESYGSKVKRTCTIEFRSGEKKEINNILENIDNVISRGVLEVEYKLDNNIVNFLNHVREAKNTLALAKDDQEMDVYLPEDKKSVKRFATYDLKIISRKPVVYTENEWILEAEIEVIYNRDLLLLIDHNILFNNSTLSDKFMKAVGRFSDKSNRHIVKELGDGYTTYLLDQDLNYNVPITDNFVPPVQNEKYVALATVVLPIDNERDFLANLRAIPGLYIPEKYVNFMLTKREMLLSDYKSLFILELYEDNNLLQNILRIDADGNLYGVRSLALNKVYRLVIRRARDASMMNQEEFTRTKEALGLDFQNMVIYLNDNDEEEFDLSASHRAWLDTFITQHAPFTLEPFVEKPLPTNYNTGELPLVLSDIVENEWAIKKPVITSEGYTEWSNFNGLLTGGDYEVIGRYPGDFYRAEWKFASSKIGETPNLEDPSIVPTELPVNTINVTNLEIFKPLTKVHSKVRYSSDYAGKPLKSEWSEPFEIVVPAIGVQPIELVPEKKNEKLYIKTKIANVTKENEAITGPVTKGPAKLTITDEDGKVVRETTIPGNREELTTLIALNGYKPGKYKIKVKQELENEWLKARGANVVETETEVDLTIDDIPFEVNEDWSIEKPTITSPGFNSNSPASTFDNFTGVLNVSEYVDTHDYPGDFDGIKVAILALDKTALAPTTLDENTPNVIIKEADENFFNLFYPEMKQNIDLTKTYYVAAKHVSKFAKHPMESGWSNILAFPMKEPKLDVEIKTEVLARNFLLSAEAKYENENEYISGYVHSGTFEYVMKNKVTGTPVTLRDNGDGKIASIDTDLEPNTDYTIEVTYKEDNAWYKARNIDTVSKTATWNMGNRPWNTEWKVAKPTLSLDGSTQDTFTGKLQASAYAAEGGFTGTEDGYEIILTQATNLTTPEDPSTWENKVILVTGLDSDKKLNYLDTLENNHLGLFAATKAAIRYYSNVTNPSGNKLYSEWGILDINLPAPEEKLTIASKRLDTDARELTITANVEHKNFYKLFMGNPDENVVAFEMYKKDDPTQKVTLNVTDLVAKVSTDTLVEDIDYVIKVSYKSTNAFIVKLGIDRAEVSDEWRMEDKPFNTNWKVSKPVLTIEGDNELDTFTGNILVSPYAVENGFSGNYASYVLQIEKRDNDAPPPTHDTFGVSPIEGGVISSDHKINLKQLILDKDVKLLEGNKPQTIYVQVKYKSDYFGPSGAVESEWSDILALPLTKMDFSFTMSEPELQADNKTVKFSRSLIIGNTYDNLVGNIDDTYYTIEAKMYKGNDETSTVTLNNANNEYSFSLDDIEEATNYKIVLKFTPLNKMFKLFGAQEVILEKVYRINEKPYIEDPSWAIAKPTIGWKDFVNGTDEFSDFPGILTLSAYTAENGYPGTEEGISLAIRDIVYKDPQPGMPGRRNRSSERIDLTIPQGTTEFNILENNMIKDFLDWGVSFKLKVKYNGKITKGSDDHFKESAWSEPIELTIPENLGKTTLTTEAGVDTTKRAVVVKAQAAMPISHTLIGDVSNTATTVTLTKGTTIVKNKVAMVNGELEIPLSELEKNTKYVIDIEHTIDNDWLKARRRSAVTAQHEVTTPKVEIVLGPDSKPIVPVEHEIPGGTGTVHIAPFKVGLDMNEFNFDPTEFKFIRKD